MCLACPNYVKLNLKLSNPFIQKKKASSVMELKALNVHNCRNTIIAKIAMPPRHVPAAVRREIDGVREWLAEQQEAARQRDDQARAQTATLEQLLTRLNEVVNPPPSAQPTPQASNPVASEVLHAFESGWQTCL